MKRNLIIAIAVIAVVVIVAASGAWICLQNPSPAPTATPTPELTAQEQARDAAITYIQTNHAQTASLLADLSWTGGRATPEGLVGGETYVYTSGNWNLTVQYPVIPNPTYTINATYAAGTTSVDWQGTCSDNHITEVSYIYSP